MRPVGARYTRGPPGPPPPRSWLTSSTHAPKHLRDRAKAGGAAERVTPDRLDRLPGVEFPATSSLLHRCLKAIAANWKWHVHYDQYYLAGVPVRIKALLLSYIAVYGEAGSLDIDGLRRIFLDENELAGATGSEELTYLDLSGAVGQGLTFRQLDHYFSDPAAASAVQQQQQQQQQQPTTPIPSRPLDSWDSEEPDPATGIPPPLRTTRFPNLTALSLAHPSTTVTASASWPRLLHFATAHLATLTHLSLAFWPPPALTPHANAKITTTASPYAPVPVSYGCSDFYSAAYGADDDWSEAAGVLMRLSRATYCLKSLDLEGCGTWLPALRWEGEGGGGGGGVEWCGGWRGVERVRVQAGLVPGGMEVLNGGEEGGGAQKGDTGVVTKRESQMETEWWDVEEERRKYYAQKEVLAWDQVRIQGEAVEAWVRKKRRLVGGLQIEFETGCVRRRYDRE